MCIQQSVKLIVLFCFLLLPAFSAALAQQGKTVTVTVKEGQNIRDIAREYLDDPNLWEEILRANNLNTPLDVKTGSVLVIPVTQILRVRDQFKSAQNALDAATDAGAKTFETALMESAAKKFDDALTERKHGNWDKAYNLALASQKDADAAYKSTMNKRNAGSDAVVSFSKGSVESRRPAESLWKNAPLFSKLFEEDKVRTLSNSLAEIQFQDLSRIRLNDNSQMVIQRSRMDPLKNTSESSVSLEKGNAFALLTGGNQNKKKFNFNIPGVKADFKSKSFWVKKEDKSTKVANYDGEIAFASSKKKVTLKENQGLTASTNGAISDPKNLLPAPQPLAPANRSTDFLDRAAFEWSAVSGAANYWLLISTDNMFKKIVFNRKDVASVSVKNHGLPAGAYYWKIASIDNEGFPGPFSERMFVVLQDDKNAPYLAVYSPEDSLVTGSSEVEVRGKSELGLTVNFNGAPLTLSDDAAFRFKHPLTPGENRLTFSAVDKAGNKTEFTRRVYLSADNSVPLEFTPAPELVAPRKYSLKTNFVTVTGTTRAGSLVVIKNASGASFRAYASDSGEFRITLRNLEGSALYSVEVTTPLGFTRTDELTIEIIK